MLLEGGWSWSTLPNPSYVKCIPCFCIFVSIAMLRRHSAHAPRKVTTPEPPETPPPSLPPSLLKPGSFQEPGAT